jgi:hypothetical protein
MQIDPERLKWLETITLDKGNHPSFASGVCAMEAVAYVANEPHSDSPSCASPVIAAFVRQWNDDLDDAGRQRLKPYVAKLVGTRAPAAIEVQRAWLATDWLVRQHTPAWLDLAGCAEVATALRDLPPLTAKTCAAAQPMIDDARQRATAAWYAAGAAARAAARAKLDPTKVSLQASALDLLDRMIALGAEG